MSWYPYDSRLEREEHIETELSRRRQKGEILVPISAPTGNKKLVQTFWGKAWCQNLEKYSDYEYRLPRGRSYLRQGHVYNLAIEPGRVSAIVVGSSFYEVNVTIAPLAASEWQSICEACAGQVGSLLDLLSGHLGAGVLSVISDSENGLFPKPKEIRLSCSCPDWADMCKHVAAVLYGVGVQLDVDPSLFFRLRSVDPSEVLASSAQELLSKAVGEELAGEDLSALFGIDFAPDSAFNAPAEVPAMEVPVPTAKPKKRPKAASKSGTKRQTKVSVASPQGGACKAKKNAPSEKSKNVKRVKEVSAKGSA